MKKVALVIALIAVLIAGTSSSIAWARGESSGSAIGTQTSPDVRVVSVPLDDDGQGDKEDFDGVIFSASDTPTGSTYMLCDNWGGNWADAEKLPPSDGVYNPPPVNANEEDDVLCWALTACNILEWTGWGFVSGLDNSDEMGDYFEDHVTDGYGVIDDGWEWWFTGNLPYHGENWTSEDVEGGDFWSGSYTYTNYRHIGPDVTKTMETIDTYLHNGWGIGIGIEGHAITVWGFNYDSNVDKITNPHDYYLGIWVTDSDDDRTQANPPDRLRYYEVAWNSTNNRCYMPSYGSRNIVEVKALEPFPENRPVANAGGSYTGSEGSPITFDGLASSDADGDALLYRWDFDNDRTWDNAWSSSPTASFTWGDDYSGTVVLEVFDGRLRDIDIATVTVLNVAPAITPFGPFTVDENSPLSLTVTSDDPGSDDLTFTWELQLGPIIVSTYYNDGVGPDPLPSPGGVYPFSATDIVGHTYGDNGIYTVTLTVEDDDGGVATYSTTITVNNVAPTITAHSMNQPNDQFILPIVHTLTFDATATDPGSDDLTFTWDWGDASPYDTEIYYNNGSNPDPYPSPEINPMTATDTAEHIYSAPGNYTVILTVTDDDGGTCTTTRVVHVADAEEAKHITNQYIQNLPDTVFKGKADQRKNAFNNMFNALDNMLAADNYYGMIQHMRNNIREKADGYIDGKQGNDWIIDRDVQVELCQKIDDITEYLEYLISIMP